MPKLRRGVGILFLAVLLGACTNSDPLTIAQRANSDSTVVFPKGFDHFPVIDGSRCSALFNGADTSATERTPRLLLVTCFDQVGPDTLRSYARMALYDIRDQEHPKLAAGVVVSRLRSLKGEQYTQVCHVAWFDKSFSRGPTPPLPYPSTIFSVGNWIETKAYIDIRNKPGFADSVIGVQASGVKGKVIEGPVLLDGYTWWNVDYQTGADGWGVGASMVKSFVSAFPPSDKFEVDEQGDCGRINSRLSVLIREILK